MILVVDGERYRTMRNPDGEDVCYNCVAFDPNGDDWLDLCENLKSQCLNNECPPSCVFTKEKK